MHVFLRDLRRDRAHDLGGGAGDAFAEREPHFADRRVREADVGAQHEIVAASLCSRTYTLTTSACAIVAAWRHMRCSTLDIGPGLGRRFDQAQDAVDAQVVALVHVHADGLAVFGHRCG